MPTRDSRPETSRAAAVFLSGARNTLPQRAFLYYQEL